MSELQKIQHPEVRVHVIHTGVGGITESDVMLAAASSAIVVGFNVRPNAEARSLAEREGVDIRTYRVIYQLTEDIEQALVGMLRPERGRGDAGRGRGARDVPRVADRHDRRLLRPLGRGARAAPRRASSATARSSTRRRSIRSSASRTTPARSPRASSAASTWTASTTSRSATSSRSTRCARSSAPTSPSTPPLRSPRRPETRLASHLRRRSVRGRQQVRAQRDDPGEHDHGRDEEDPDQTRDHRQHAEPTQPGGERLELERDRRRPRAPCRRPRTATARTAGS